LLQNNPSAATRSLLFNFVARCCVHSARFIQHTCSIASPVCRLVVHADGYIEEHDLEKDGDGPEEVDGPDDDDRDENDDETVTR
jgi:hypothetical protein